MTITLCALSFLLAAAIQHIRYRRKMARVMAEARPLIRSLGEHMADYKNRSSANLNLALYYHKASEAWKDLALAHEVYIECKCDRDAHGCRNARVAIQRALKTLLELGEYA